MVTFWPFWLGALALAAIAVGFMIATGRGLGVSGALSTVLDQDARRDEARAVGAEAMQTLLAAETQALLSTLSPEQRLKMADDAPAPVATPALAPRLKWSSYALFLAALVLGGALASLMRGGALQTTLDPTYVKMFGNGPLAWALLFVGGVLVGGGTRLAGGCTSGHGLVGIARMQWPSLVATAIFFGTAIVVSFLVGGAV